MKVEEKPDSRRGGRREGAGRKRANQNAQDPRHEKRKALDCKFPVHVMLRTTDGVPRLRQRTMYEAIRRVLLRYVEGADFRVVHISLQHNHIHMIVEASNEECLTRRMQSFAINAARAINGAAERSGKVFKFRYKAKQLRSRDYVRNAIAYVLNNWRRHREDTRDRNWGNTQLDAFSSAVTFTGWKGRKRWKIPDDYSPLPVSPPRTSLLQSDWQWFGLIDPFEIPGRRV